MIAVFCGGIGAGRFLQGLVQTLPQREVTVISNTGDDVGMFGLHGSPDIRIGTYHLAALFGLGVAILPMTDDRVRTRVVTDEGELDFQDYMVRRQADARVKGVQYEGVLEAKPAPGVIEAILEAEGVVLAPSNPIASIGPILAARRVRGA